MCIRKIVHLMISTSMQIGRALIRNVPGPATLNMSLKQRSKYENIRAQNYFFSYIHISFPSMTCPQERLIPQFRFSLMACCS